MKAVKLLPIACVIFLLCIESRAQITFEKTFGGSNTDIGYSLQQTQDGGYIIAGYTESFGTGVADIYLIKTNPNGDTLWTRIFGGSSTDYGYSVQQTNDGGYIIAGTTYNGFTTRDDIYLIKTDASGNILWNKTFGGAYSDNGFSVKQTNDGGYIIAGSINGQVAWSRDNVYLIKTDANGDTLWTKVIVDDPSRNYYGYCVQQTTDGGYIVAGYTKNDWSWSELIYLVKTNSLGDTLWTRKIGGATTNFFGYYVVQTSDGGYIISGETFNPFGPGNYVYLVRIDANGNTLWSKMPAGLGSGNCVRQTSDGGFIITGGGGKSIIKTDANGDTLWTRTYGGINAVTGFSIQQTSDGGYVMGGNIYYSLSGELDAYLVKTDVNGNIGISGIEKSSDNSSQISIYPNPFSDVAILRIMNTEQRTTNYELKIYDLLGREVKRLTIDDSQITIHRDNLPGGMYMYRVESENKGERRIITTGKIVIQ